MFPDGLAVTPVWLDGATGGVVVWPVTPALAAAPVLLCAATPVCVPLGCAVTSLCGRPLVAVLPLETFDAGDWLTLILLITVMPGAACCASCCAFNLSASLAAVPINSIVLLVKLLRFTCTVCSCCCCRTCCTCCTCGDTLLSGLVVCAPVVA